MSGTDTGAETPGNEPGAIRQCSNCGAALNAGQLFCTQCGASASPGGTGGATASQPAPLPSSPVKRSPAVRTLRILGGVAAVFVGLVAIISGVREMRGAGRGHDAQPAPYTGMGQNGWPGQPPGGGPGQPQVGPMAQGPITPPTLPPGAGMPGQDGSGPPQPGPGVPPDDDGPQAPAGAMPPGQDGPSPMGPAGPGGGPSGGQGGGSAPPPGMVPLQSPVGAVFRSHMNGSASASKLAQAMSMGVAGWFDGPPQLLNRNGDPQDRTAQWTFRGSKNGTPLAGLFLVQSDGQNGGQAYMVVDRADRFQQSMGTLVGAAQADLQGGMRQ